MALSNKKYWANRIAITQMKLANRNIRETEKQLRKYYSSSANKIVGQFEKIYTNVLSNISEDKEPTPADLYRLDAYWHLQGELKQELDRLTNKQLSLFEDRFIEQYAEIYEALPLKSDLQFRKADRKMAQQMINQIWCADGEMWSQRVWKNTTKLHNSLNENLIDCLLTGRNPEELKKQLMEQYRVAHFRADCIVRTEMAKATTDAAEQRYKDYGIKEVEVLIEPDACEECLKLKGKKFSIYDAPLLPVHPNCRCCIVPVIE